MCLLSLLVVLLGVWTSQPLAAPRRAVAKPVKPVAPPTPAATPAPATPVVQPPPDPAPALAKTLLRVLCSTDGAELVLDGEVLGTTPFKEPFPVSPGEHTIRVSRLGFTPYIDVFKAKPGQTTKFDVELTPIAGVLGITAKSVQDGPAVRVFIDDKFFGKAPLETELPLGNHQVRVERPGFYSETFEIKAEPGKRIDKDIELKPLPPDQNPYLAKTPQVRWYQKWWVWTLVAVGVAVVATAIIVPVVLSQKTVCSETDACTTIPAAPLTIAPMAEPNWSPRQAVPMGQTHQTQMLPGLTVRF